MQVLASNPKFCKEEPKFNIQIRQDKGEHSANGQGNGLGQNHFQLSDTTLDNLFLSKICFIKSSVNIL